MINMKKLLLAAVCVAVGASILLPPILRAADPAPSTAPAAAGKRRTEAAVAKDLNATGEEINKAMPNLRVIGDAEFREKQGPTILPILKKMNALLAEMEDVATDPADIHEAEQDHMLTLALAAAFGDTDALKQLEEGSKRDNRLGILSHSYYDIARWLLASKDATAQAKVLEDVTALAKENGANKHVAQAVGLMANLGAANDELGRKVQDLLTTSVAAANAAPSEDQAQKIQAALVGKPLTIEGRTSTDSKFTSADYKGKVVMLDFWATWCGPCIGELPNVKKAYADYHGKGFEIVGLSCDDNDGELNAFTKKNEMTWVQLREKSQTPDTNNWHPLALKYGVLGIPTMFLIDRNGVVRYVDARDNLEKKIAELIAEQPKQ